MVTDLITFEPLLTQTFDTLKAKLSDRWKKLLVGKVDAILVLPNKKLEGGMTLEMIPLSDLRKCFVIDLKLIFN
jgi:hypothetical protein